MAGPLKLFFKGLTLLVGLFIFWLFAIWPPPIWYASHWPATTAFMAAREQQTPPKNRKPRQYRPVPLDSIARQVQDAVIIGEDNNFPTHHGVDQLALAHALGYRRDTFSWASSRDREEMFALLAHAWERRDKLRGASTITQQLAKNLYLSGSRNPWRKVKEAVIGFRLEAALGKPRIMELYLNVAELGDGVWGVEAASRKYFKRSAKALSTEQAAALAGALPFPLSSNPSYHPSRMRWRQDLILRRMRGEWVEIPKVEAEDLPPVVIDTAATDTLGTKPPIDSDDTSGIQDSVADDPADTITVTPDTLAPDSAAP